MIKEVRALGTATDPRELPAYTLGEAAHYLRIPRATLRAWVRGRPYPTRAGRKFFRPIIALPSPDTPVLSFLNLVEAHVLGAIRREHEIPFLKVRRALHFLAQRYPSRHPLADQRFVTDGLDLFVEKYGQLISATMDGQLAIRKFLKAYLQRIDRDRSGVPTRLFPFTRHRELEEMRTVVIDPFVAFGRPVIAGTSIATSAVAERFQAGESFEALAADYERPLPEIEEAIRCELELEAA